MKKRPWLSALAIYLLSYIIVSLQPTFLSGVLGLYKVHLLAFPLGILAAGLLKNNQVVILSALKGNWRKIVYYLSLAALIFIAGYTAYYSGVGKGPLAEELMSLLTMAAILGVFILKKIELRLLYIFGIFSYEIYLLHWPILYRYDIFFFWLPGWLAMLLYLAFFLGLGWLLQELSKLKLKNRV